MRAQSITAPSPNRPPRRHRSPQKSTGRPPATLYWPWITDHRFGRFSFLTLRDQCRPPFFRAFHALAVDDGGGRTGFPLGLCATLFIKRVVDPFQRAVIGPQIEIAVD